MLKRDWSDGFVFFTLIARRVQLCWAFSRSFIYFFSHGHQDRTNNSRGPNKKWKICQNSITSNCINGLLIPLITIVVLLAERAHWSLSLMDASHFVYWAGKNYPPLRYIYMDIHGYDQSCNRIEYMAPYDASRPTRMSHHLWFAGSRDAMRAGFAEYTGLAMLCLTLENLALV